jgi:probable rRNA maturation factor
MDDDDHLDPRPDPRPDPPLDLWPRVLISNRQRRAVDDEGLRGLARDTLRGEGIQQAELSVSFVDADEIADLHERFMDEPGPTDVLSFPLGDLDLDVDENGVRLLGDVVVAPSEAERNNPEDPDAELRLLLVHGILHLLGYDHEEDGARIRMWERQERYSGVRSP